MHEGAGGGRPGYAQRKHGEGATEASKQQSNDHFAIGCRYPNRWETRLESVGAWVNIVRLHVCVNHHHHRARDYILDVEKHFGSPSEPL